MKFVNDTRFSPEVFEDSIPIIHGQNYYIDDQGFACSYNNQSIAVYDSLGNDIIVQSMQQVTEFIYVINQKLAYLTTGGIVVTDLVASKENYRGGFQGIVGFDETSVEYQYLNSETSAKSSVTMTARINSSKKLEIYLENIGVWVVPLGEFRCYIDSQLYTVSYDTTLPNAYGDTFEIALQGWTTQTLSSSTNYIRDMFISGNTLYISTRLQLIGSAPYLWSTIDTSQSTVVWSEDSRLIGGYFVGNPTASCFYIVNYTTSSIYWIDASNFDILQEYQHKQPILGTGSIDKFTIAVVDKEAVTLLASYVSLNTWLIKAKLYFKFNQLSAYEDITTNYLREEVKYVKDIDSLVIKSTQRATMMLYILNNQILSGCHTSEDIVLGDWSAYLPVDGALYKYTKVEDNGEYDEVDLSAGITNFDSFIYIGSDLEPDVGGSTMRDTEIKFEGKLALIDGDDVSVESSSDVPTDTSDLPVRTQQINQDNWWYLYTKTLRYPVSYTDWIKISLMPTTKIFDISLVPIPGQETKKSKKGKK